jgi:hypothetical protein
MYIRRIYPLVVLSMFLASSMTNAEELPQSLTMKTTVGEFALACQHSGLKTHSDMRLYMCASYLLGTGYQIAMSKKSPECWEAIETGAASLSRTGELLFHLATLPDQRGRQVGEAARQVIVEVTAKQCK